MNATPLHTLPEGTRFRFEDEQQVYVVHQCGGETGAVHVCRADEVRGLADLQVMRVRPGEMVRTIN